jgi:hypothetical protein
MRFFDKLKLQEDALDIHIPIFSRIVRGEIKLR